MPAVILLNSSQFNCRNMEEFILDSFPEHGLPETPSSLMQDEALDQLSTTSVGHLELSFVESPFSWKDGIYY